GWLPPAFTMLVNEYAAHVLDTSGPSRPPLPPLRTDSQPASQQALPPPAPPPIADAPPASRPADSGPPASRWRGYLVERWGIAVSVGLGAVGAAVTARVVSDPGWLVATGALVATVCYVTTVGVGILTDRSTPRTDPSSQQAAAETQPQQPVS